MPYISVSSLRSMDACKRKAAMMYHLHLRSIYSETHLVIGSSVHTFLALYYQNPFPDATTERFERIWKFTEEYFWQEIKKLPIDEEAAKSALEIVARLCYHYPRLAFNEDVSNRIIPLAIETKFEIQFTPNTVLEGVIDLLMESRWGMGIVDHKTAKSATANYFRNLRLDIQQICYCWATRELVRQQQIDYDPKVFALNAIAKTKEPYRKIETVPLNWERIDSLMEDLRGIVLDDIETLPNNLEAIWEMPKDIRNCRNCQFESICFASKVSHAQAIINSDFVTERYSRPKMPTIE